MPDQRELYEDPEEAIRAAWAGIRTHMMTAMPAIIESDSPDGHTGRLVLAVKRAVEDKDFDKTSYQPFPLLADVPIHFPGAGGITHTFAVKALDEVMTIFSSRSIDAWHQSGGTQQPIFNRLHSISDAMMIPGMRSDPRKLQQVSTDSAQARDDAKHHTDDHHPTNGFKRKTVDPSTAPASSSFDPFTQATKFFEHLAHPTDGVHANATDGSTTHNIGLTHLLGAIMQVANGLHSVAAHPTNGASLNAANGAHMVQAHPTDGVKVMSSVAHTIDAPSTSVSGGMNVAGALSGASAAFDSLSVAGQPVSGGSSGGGGGSGNLTGATTVSGLPVAGNDAAAAAVGVVVGGLYIDRSAVPGHNLLAVRVV